MTDPLEQHHALTKLAQDAQRMLAPTQSVIEQIIKSSAFLTCHRSGLAGAMLELRRHRELLEPRLGVQRIAEQMQAAQAMADQLRRDFGFAINAINNQSTQWRALVEPAIQQLNQLKTVRLHMEGLADNFVAWESTAAKLARRFNETGLIAHSATLADRLFVPNQVFTDFARETIARIEQATDARNAWALRTSLRLAEEQLIATTDSLGAFVVVPDDQDEISVSLKLRSPYVQQDELLAAAGEIDDEDESALVQASPAADAVDVSRRVLMAIAACNEARKVAGREEIFKPTTRLLEVYADMPWLVPTTKSDFAAFVDCLYFLFYEGAGKDNLRFLKANGGPIEDGDFEFILCIKHLRNKWTRHDADHGKESSIRKSWSELSAKFKWLGLTRMPLTAEDFRLLHMNLLAQSLVFVNKILRGVAGE